MELRERLAGLLEMRDWSQGKLAARTGISRSHITMFLNGQRQDMGFSKIRTIARALDVSLRVDCYRLHPDPLAKEEEPRGRGEDDGYSRSIDSIQWRVST